MSGFGFGVRTETTSCPEIYVEVQAYKDQSPIGFHVRSNHGTPTIDFPDGTRLFIKHKSRDPKDGKEYTLEVAKKAKAIVKKIPYDEDDDDE
jgi:hypothetical protein